MAKERKQSWTVSLTEKEQAVLVKKYGSLTMALLSLLPSKN